MTICTLLPSLVHRNINAYKCLCSCSVCSGSGVCGVMYLSLPQWYTEAPKHNLSRSSRVGFVDWSVLLVCLHLSGEDTPSWCYYSDSFFLVSCLHRCEQNFFVLSPVKVKSQVTTLVKNCKPCTILGTQAITSSQTPYHIQRTYQGCNFMHVVGFVGRFVDKLLLK